MRLSELLFRKEFNFSEIPLKFKKFIVQIHSEKCKGRGKSLYLKKEEAFILLTYSLLLARVPYAFIHGLILERSEMSNSNI
jgi:membrane protein CcdC involved in cytochrome C biogenesis